MSRGGLTNLAASVRQRLFVEKSGDRILIFSAGFRARNEYPVAAFPRFSETTCRSFRGGDLWQERSSTGWFSLATTKRYYLYKNDLRVQ